MTRKRSSGRKRPAPKAPAPPAPPTRAAPPARAAPARVAEPAGWTTWAEPPRGTPGSKASERRQGAGRAARQRVLEAARAHFAQKGYAGTAVRDITVEAEVNVGAVTYHFGSKLELYHEVLRDITRPLRHRMETIHGSRRPPLEKLERTVREFFQHVRNHPALIPLMVREMAGAGELAPPIRDTLRTVLPLLVRTIEDGQRDGRIRPGDPLLLALSTLAQPVYLNLAKKGIAAATGMDPNAPELFDRVVEHCVVTVHHALRTPGEDAP